MCVWVCVGVCVRVYLSVYIYVCVCAFIYQSIYLSVQGAISEKQFFFHETISSFRHFCSKTHLNLGKIFVWRQGEVTANQADCFWCEPASDLKAFGGRNVKNM